jgi:diguanylate cyclase (GGDEF)-like protein
VAAGLLLLAVVVLLVRRMRQSNRALSASNARLKVASERDALTGLANRRHFQAVMRQAQDQPAQVRPLAGPVPAAGGSGALEGSLLLIDVDHFKHINDRHGHATGDAVLVEIAQRLVATLREHDLTVRWGGEEFLVYARGLPPEQVDMLAERLLSAIGSVPVKHGRERIAVTASIGFATFPLLPERRPIDWERAVDLVDKAMYLAKAHGRNRAYGVRALSSDEQHPGGVARGLESAWRSGRAQLSRVPGPAAPAAAGQPAAPAEPPGATLNQADHAADKR